MKGIPYLLIFSLTGIFGCTLVSPTSSTVRYGEDLSAHRPQVETDTSSVPQEEPQLLTEVTPQYHSTAELEGHLRAISNQNKSDGTVNGFTIQVYSGTSRENASKAKAQVYRILPDSRPETKYEQPVYKVRVGEFGDRLEAQVIYAELQEEFPDAIVIPHRIKL